MTDREAQGTAPRRPRVATRGHRSAGAQARRPCHLVEPVIQLYPYQRRFFDDPARVLVGIWCRQAGKDFVTAALAVDNALRTNAEWYIVSLTQRQADATFAKCKRVARALQGALAARARPFGETADDFDARDPETGGLFRFTSRRLELPGGGSVTSLPGRDPDTLAGLTGNVVFTEFGLFPNGGYEHWRTVFPLSTRGYRVVVISTPRGRNTKLYELASGAGGASVHTVPIDQAVAEGMPLRDEQGRPCGAEDLRRAYADEAGWQREYLCQFSGDLEALISWAKLLAAGERGAGQPFQAVRLAGSAPWDDRWWQPLAAEKGRLDVGWDVARRGHLSVVWVNRRVAGDARALRAIVIMRGCDFALQKRVICGLMDRRRDAAGSGDSTGLGMQANEELAARYGARWEGVDFSGTRKRELASLLRTAFDDAVQALPAADGEHRYVHTDLYALQAEPGDKPTVAESDNPLLPESHCDLAWSAALALHAGTRQFARTETWVV